MTNKNFILNADDFGLSNCHNQAVLEGYMNGFLTSASLMANAVGYENAVHDILPDCQNLSIAAHLNIVEGKSLTSVPLLTDSNGNFNKSYAYFIMMQNNKEFQKQIEQEFRAQIEKIKSDTEVTHIDSHVHTHAIPAIFKITCKLAQEYDIKAIRTQYEKFYYVPKLNKIANIKFPINLLKIALLNYFTIINKKILKKYNLLTNDYILGVGYTAMMDSDTIECGLKPLGDDTIVEALIHPCKYDNYIKNSHTDEYLITLDSSLKNEIIRMGYDITNYKNLCL